MVKTMYENFALLLLNQRLLNNFNTNLIRKYCGGTPLFINNILIGHKFCYEKLSRGGGKG
jgi:hypothetical protein